MSVSPPFARQLQRALGTEVGDDMVRWMNRSTQEAVETRRRLEARFERLQARFERLEYGVKQIESRLDRIDATLEKMQVVLESTRKQIAELDILMANRHVVLESAMNKQIAELGALMANRHMALESTMNKQVTELSALLANRHADFVRWTLGFWVASLVALLAGVFGIARQFQ